jgi:hypothetical protein
MFPGAGTPAGLALQAIRAVGLNGREPDFNAVSADIREREKAFNVKPG